MTGYVYALESADAFKIGWSAHPRQRCKQVKSRRKVDCRLVGCAKAERSDEYQVHALLKPWQIRGEWFRKEGLVLAFVRALPAPEPEPHMASRPVAECEAALRRAVAIAGSQSELARRISRGQSVISFWLKNGGSSADMCAAIETATSGAVTRQELRPDLFGERGA